MQTSETQHAHRSTLNYRMERIEKVAEVSLSDATTRTNLQVALKLMRLLRWNGRQNLQATISPNTP